MNQSNKRRSGDGIDRHRPNFVAPIQRMETPAFPIDAEVTHTINVPPSATQHVEVRTDAVDRAKGFLLASVPLYAAFATVTVGVCVVGVGVPALSLPTLLIFFLAFVAAWVIGYCYTLQTSAEGISLFEAQEKWKIIRIEQANRWQAWRRSMGVDDDEFE